MHKFSKNLEVTSKLYAPEGWHEASSILRTHHSKFSRPGDLASGICALMSYGTYINTEFCNIPTRYQSVLRNSVCWHTTYGDFTSKLEEDVQQRAGCVLFGAQRCFDKPGGKLIALINKAGASKPSLKDIYILWTINFTVSEFQLFQSDQYHGELRTNVT
jgi:hypothetical protein